MEDGFLRDCLIIYIENEIAMEFTTDELIDDFDAIQTRRAKCKWNMLIPLTIYAYRYIFHRKIVNA